MIQYNQCNYTEHQKETYHFFGVTFTEIHCFKISHLWIKICSTRYEAHLQRLALPWVRKMQWNHKAWLYQKITEIAHWSHHTKYSLFIHSISVVGFVINALPLVCSVQWAHSWALSMILIIKALFVISLHPSPFWPCKQPFFCWCA